MGLKHVLMALATLAIAGLLGIVVTVITGDDDGEEADTSPLVAAPRSGRPIEHSGIGAKIRKPRGWSHRRSGNTLSLRSPDRTVIMSISLPAGTDRSAAVLQTGVAAIRRQYGKVQAIGADTRRVANLPTNSVITSATNSRGVRLRILTSAPQGRTRAWLVQIFSAARSRERRLAEAQVAIETLSLTG